MSNKVFVVTAGEYDNYHIVGIFSSREKAIERCPAVLDRAGGAQIEELEMNAVRQPNDDAVGADEFLQAIFKVFIDVNSGVPSELIVESIDCEFHPKGWHDTSVSTLKPHYDLVCAESTISLEHERQIAEEARQDALKSRSHT
jgi:hypothetical protein